MDQETSVEKWGDSEEEETFCTNDYDGLNNSPNVKFILLGHFLWSYKDALQPREERDNKKSCTLKIV